MASNQTEHYGLSLRAGTDQFTREEFNEDNVRVDAAIARKLELEIGTYSGNGDSVRVIPLEAKATAVLIYPCDGWITTTGGIIKGGVATSTQPMKNQDGALITITDEGIQLENHRKDSYGMNQVGTRYVYLAFR